MGADLVGKVEAGIPEDDPRNPATIADNVGDNVGDCAGMASDLFESFGVVLVANIILGVTSFRAIGFSGEDVPRRASIFPLAMMAIGLLASMVSIFLVKARAGETDALKPINRGLNVASVLTLVGAAVSPSATSASPDGSTGHPRRHPHVLRRSSPAWCSVRWPVASPSTSRRATFKPVRDIADSGITGPGHRGAVGHLERHGVGRVGSGRHRRSDPGRPRRWAAASRCSPSTWSR